MLKNYLTIAIRTLLRFKGFALINLIGLSLGLTAGILILMFVVDELSFDKFHEKRDRTYRVLTQFFNPKTGGGETAMETNGWPVGDVLRREFPDVESVVYLRNGSGFLINHQGKRFRQKLQFASPEFLQVFSFPLIKGDPTKALQQPWTIVISEEMEQKFFPGADALNKQLTLADTLQFQVTGVMKNIPSNSHIQVDMVASFASFERISKDFSYEDGWGNINMRNYLLLREGVDAQAFALKAKDIYTERVPDMLKNWGVSCNVVYEPMSDIYLRSKTGNSLGPSGSIERVYLVSGIAIFVMLLACINFVNLATARSVYRAREVGLRKVSGSTRWGLIRQFMAESFVMTALSFIIALVITWLFLPTFNQLMQKNYEWTSLLSPTLVGGVAILLIAVSALAGFYPALVLSAMNAVEVLKGRIQTSARGVQLRRALVIFQFVISSVLVSGTFIVIGQLNYMQQQTLGFEKDNLIVLNATRAKAANPEGYETLKNQIKSLSIVDAVTFTNALPAVAGWDGQVAYPEGKSGDDAVSVQYMAVDADYVPTLGLEIIHGRNFDLNRPTDLADGLVINETAASLMGWSSEEAIGKKITSPSGFPQGEVIGVVKDYHNVGLQRQISPLVMDINPRASYLYAIRYKASDTRQLIGNLQELWSSMFPGFDFNYFFLDDTFNEQYQSEEKLARVFALFALVTVAIAAIGLLGLVSFLVVSRTKEIGVRKILGASVLNVTSLLSKEFVVLVIIANVIAIPIAWYFAKGWLQGFAFRSQVNPWLFAITLLTALGLTLLTVGYQTARAALANPVKSLRYE